MQQYRLEELLRLGVGPDKNPIAMMGILIEVKLGISKLTDKQFDERKLELSRLQMEGKLGNRKKINLIEKKEEMRRRQVIESLKIPQEVLDEVAKSKLKRTDSTVVLREILEKYNNN